MIIKLYVKHIKITSFIIDRLIHNKYAFDRNTYIKDTPKQSLTWKPMRENHRGDIHVA